MPLARAKSALTFLLRMLPGFGAQQLPASARLQSLRRPGNGDGATLSPIATEGTISPDDAPFQILDARTGEVRRRFPQLGPQVRGPLAVGLDALAAQAKFKPPCPLRCIIIHVNSLGTGAHLQREGGR